MVAVTLTSATADKLSMSLHESVVPGAVGDDFGLAGHLAAIERMHREALTQLDALMQPWVHLWGGPGAAAPPKTEEFPVVVQPQIHGAHVEVAS